LAVRKSATFTALAAVTTVGEFCSLPLLDLMMPVLGDAGMLRAMAAEPAHERIQVIMTGPLEEHVSAQIRKNYLAFLLSPSEMPRC
jgi:CheY-like chemotaxis protein